MDFELHLPNRGPLVVGDYLRIGRDPGNDMVLDNSMVSRQHAILVRTHNGLAIHDEHSTNGTFVNNARVHGTTPVHPGDSIRVGNYTFRVQSRPPRAAEEVVRLSALQTRHDYDRPPPRRRRLVVRLSTLYIVLATAAFSTLVALGLTTVPNTKSSQFVLPTPVAALGPGTPTSGSSTSKPPAQSAEWANVFDQSAPDVAVVENQAAAISGTAFFIDSTHALTNAHVVKGATTVRLTGFVGDGTQEATTRGARVLASDSSIDLAVLSVAEPAPGHLMIGDVGAVRVGDDVMAIGDPHGLGWTATFGRVSAVRRGADFNLDAGVTALQFDAAINPGNSGGPLIARNGTVVGIVTFGMRNASGLSFALAGEPLWAQAREWVARDSQVR